MSRIENPREAIKDGSTGIFCLSITCQYGLLTIDRQNIIAFGDEHNDLEMLDAAGRGVAMHNAIPELKSIANDVTPIDNEHNGLAKYLRDYFKVTI